MSTVGTYAIPRLDLGVAMQEYSGNNITRIGQQILPIFKTPKKSAAFSKITRESLVRSRNVKRAPRGEYNRDETDNKDQLYNCEERGFEQLLDDTERTLHASDFNAELQASQFAMNVVLAEQEKDTAALLFNTSVWTGASLFTDNKATPWSTVGTDIIAQVSAGREKVRANCGMRANALILGYGALVNLKQNTGIKDAVKYSMIPTEAAILQNIAGLFGVSKIFVGDSITNTAKQGPSAFASSDVWSKKYAMLALVAESDNLSEACLGRTMLWTSDSPEAINVEEYRAERNRSSVYRARNHSDEVVFDPMFAHLLQIEV